MSEARIKTRVGMGRRYFVAGLVLCTVALPQRAASAEPDAAAVIHESVQALTEVMVHDVFSPPQASRSYAYSLVALYEALRHQNPAYRSYSGQLNDLADVPQPEPGLTYDWPLAAAHAFMRVAEQFVFSQARFRALQDEIMMEFSDAELQEEVRVRSLAYGELVANHILAWSITDGYARTRSMPRYAVASNEPGAWEPTPPAYMDAVEPHWNKLRPFSLDAADQFLTWRPIPFDQAADSPFLEEVMGVHRVGVTLTQEQREIAAFWDCNPFVVHQQGHLTYGMKKITPGGHWMGITSIAIKKRGDDPVQAAAAYSLVAVALADGFIVAWDEKYRSNRIRPETAIRRYLDPAWQPLLQTPPFPEYPSAHSVISRAAAAVLTHLYGDDFAYIDDVEEAYGLSPRLFNSFLDAANEAAMSRLYGGIHYRQAIEAGVEQGRQLGEWIVNKISLVGAPGERHPASSTVGLRPGR